MATLDTASIAGHAHMRDMLESPAISSNLPLLPATTSFSIGGQVIVICGAHAGGR
jgi:hypothetical protein